MTLATPARSPARAPGRLLGGVPIPAAMLLSVGGVAAGWALAGNLSQVPPHRAADVAFRLAALAALPLPLLNLHLLTTPPHGAVRRALGELASTQVRRSLRVSAWWLAVALSCPLGLGLGLAVGPAPGSGGSVGSACWSLTAMIAVAQLGAWAASAALVLLAAGLVAGGRREAFVALSGGGNFGPAEAAPLLYAPAVGLVAGLLPAALLSAWLGARPDSAGPEQAAIALVATGVLALGLLRQAMQSARPTLFGALRAVELAHATPFAQGQLLPPVPRWLARLSTGAPGARWLALGWSRHHPAAPAISALVAGVALLAGSPSAPPWAWVGVGVGIGWHAVLRAGAVLALESWPTASWLGATPRALVSGRIRLALALGSLGALATTLALVAVPAWAPLLGLALGAGAGLGLTRLRPVLWQPWLAPAGLALCGLCLAWTA